jgi:hypothetical protein
MLCAFCVCVVVYFGSVHLQVALHDVSMSVSAHRRDLLCLCVVRVLSVLLGMLDPGSLTALYPDSLSRSFSLHCTVPQGTPKVDTQFMLAKAGVEAIVKTAEQMHKKPEPDATIFATRCVTVTVMHYDTQCLGADS